MNYICREGTIQILRDDTVEDEKLKDRKDFIATCELASLTKGKQPEVFNFFNHNQSLLFHFYLKIVDSRH